MFMKTAQVVILSVVFGLALVVQAVGRVQPSGSTTMVICAGRGNVTVTLDADGNLALLACPCRDCLPNLAVVLLTVVRELSSPQSQSGRLVVPEPALGQMQVVVPSQARGPPLLV